MVTQTNCYDALGRPYEVSQQAGSGNSTLGYVDDGSNVALAYNGSTSIGSLLGLGLVELFQLNFNGTLQSSVLKDPLGSVVGLSGSAKTITDLYQYEPYGASTHTSGTSLNNYQFAGQANDFNNLYYHAQPLLSARDRTIHLPRPVRSRRRYQHVRLRRRRPGELQRPDRRGGIVRRAFGPWIWFRWWLHRSSSTRSFTCCRFSGGRDWSSRRRLGGVCDANRNPSRSRLGRGRRKHRGAEDRKSCRTFELGAILGSGAGSYGGGVIGGSFASAAEYLGFGEYFAELLSNLGGLGPGIAGGMYGSLLAPTPSQGSLQLQKPKGPFGGCCAFGPPNVSTGLVGPYPYGGGGFPVYE